MKRKTILNYYSKSIISLLLIILLSFSILPPTYTSSESIKLPSGWNFSSSYQNIPVTLNKVTYYAYEIYKVDNNKKTVGWLIVDSNNKVITDKDTYEKLAMAATVTKWFDISQVMEITSLTDGLKSLDWQISWFEKSSGVIKILNSVAGILVKHRTATMTINDAAKSVSTIGEGIINLVPIDLEDEYLNEIVEKSADSYITLLISSGSLLEDLTKGYNPLPEFFSLVKAILRKAAYIGFKHGYKNLLKANEILKTHSGPWSYEEANDLLTYLEEGEPFAIAYANWYSTLIPSSNWEAVWRNVFEPLLPAFADLTNGMKQNLLNQASVPTEKIIMVLDSQGNLSMPVIVKEQIDLFSLAANYTQISIVNGAVVYGEKAGPVPVLVDKFKKFFEDFIKLYQNPLHYNKVLDDIKFYSSKFNIYRAFYDVSIEDSPASRTYNAIKNEEEASVKDKTIYKIGDRVQATDYINVREDASLTGKVKSVIKKGEIGTIESNYKIADGYRWWTVKWDSGPEGWCAGEYLQLYTITAKDYYFPSVTTTVNINSDGSFDVVEKRTYEFSGDFHWATYILAKEGYTKLENFSIGDDNGNYKMTTSETGDSGTYTFSENSSSYTAKFFYSANNEKKTFTIRYRIIGGIKAYEDVADFYWKLVGTGWDKKTGYFEAYIYLPSKVNENSLYVFGHGPSYGTIQKIDGNGVYYKVSNLPANTIVEVRVVFPSNILSTTKIPGSKLDSILKYENGSSEEGNQGKWVLVLGESLPVLSGISPAGYALIGGECEKSPICWDTLSLVHSGDLLEYISTDTKTYSSSSTLSFPGCSKAYKVKDKNGNIGWLIGEWGGIVLAQVIDSKTTQNFRPVSFSKITGKWSGHWRGTFFEEGDLSFVFQQENMLTFSGTGVLTWNGSDKTRNVTVKGSIVNNSLSFLEAQPDGSYKYYSGTISSDGKTIEGWKYSYDSLAVPLGEFKLTFQGN